MSLLGFSKPGQLGFLISMSFIFLLYSCGEDIQKEAVYNALADIFAQFLTSSRKCVIFPY